MHQHFCSVLMVAAEVSAARPWGLASRLAITQEIYTHDDRQAQHDALAKISRAVRDKD